MNWIIPSLKEEIGEFERVTNTFGLQLSSLISLFETGTVEDLDDETWSKLENTDSWGTIKLEQAFEAAEQNERDAQALLEAFRAGRPMQTPIVLVFADGGVYLVSGNTRLMLCRATGERPKILKLRRTL